MKRLIWILCTFLSGTGTIAQPSYIYEGGDGGGFNTVQDSSNVGYQFLGAYGTGYSAEHDVVETLFQYIGGMDAGYLQVELLNLNPGYYKGGENDGNAIDQLVGDQNVHPFQGGNGHGYELTGKNEDFIWTGTVGTGWAVAENWNYTIVPDINRRTIIPAGVPNFPNINAGIFAIGENPNNGQFECKAIWIQENAEVITRVNNFIENRGVIRIDGLMQVKNTASNAFQNSTNGLIQIKSTGSLLIKP